MRLTFGHASHSAAGYARGLILKELGEERECILVFGDSKEEADMLATRLIVAAANVEIVEEPPAVQ